MSVNLTIESATHAKAILAIELGKPLRVGRTALADYVVEDQFLSKVHFAVGYDGSSCWMRDLQSTNGTRLNGLPACESKLSHGDIITAGQTKFTVSIADDARAKEAVAPDAPIDYERLLVPMRRGLQLLYMVVDTAVDPRILPMLMEAKLEYYSLFQGEASSLLVQFEPYLVPLTAESPLLDVFVKQGWGKNWGVYLTSNAGLRELWEFLTRLLITRLPEGGNALLRFYDPRVLRVLLMSSTPEQQRRLFGPISFYLMEADEVNQGLCFAMDGYGLKKTELFLSGTRPAQTTVVERISAAGFERTLYGGETTIFLPREDQSKQIAGTQCNPFRDKMVEEIQTLFPVVFARVGKGAVEELVGYGGIRPKRYGISAPEDLRHYIYLMVQLGRDFDVDPLLPWASSLLTRRLEPSEKLNRLKLAAAEHQSTC